MIDRVFATTVLTFKKYKIVVIVLLQLHNSNLRDEISLLNNGIAIYAFLPLMTFSGSQEGRAVCKQCRGASLSEGRAK